MYFTLRRPLAKSSYSYKNLHSLRCSTTHSKISQPLRILFCGSDEFSCAHLQAIHKRRQELNIESLDVMCRPGKLSGRGMKKIREVPIKSLAQGLGLRLHERDTFTGWTIPKTELGHPINLIIAVSFGLFVPPRILKSVEYGGLNVHPSLLPDLRGPAPIYHSLLQGDTVTGVTLQTLDPERFDHGKILLQKSFKIATPANEESSWYALVLKQASIEGGRLLVNGLRDAVFLPDHKSSQIQTLKNEASPLRHAPKITDADRELKLDEANVSEMIRQERVLGKVWARARLYTGETRRLVLSGLSSIEDSKAKSMIASIVSKSGQSNNKFLGIFPARASAYTVLTISAQDDTRLIIATTNSFLAVEHITVEGDKKKPAKLVMESYQFDPGPGRQDSNVLE